jgi:metallo-beta-lactamase class B
MIRGSLLIAVLLMSAQAGTFRADPPKDCASCAEWNALRTPFRVFGNTYYVGVGGLSSLLVTSDEGHILLDGALPESAPVIDRNIRALGFRTGDVKLIVTSHTHYDHVGGVAALQRASGAEVAASPLAAQALRTGEPNPSDPQFALGVPERLFPAVQRVREIKDRETLRVGSLAVTAHFTPGHTPGGTSWTWRSCEGSRCVDVVYADSLNAVSADGFRFTAGAKPTPADQLRASIARIESLPCEIIVSVHPGFTQLDEKASKLGASPAVNPFIDREGCRRYAADARARLEQRVSSEK